MFGSRGSNLPSVMGKNFSRIPAPNIQRSVFNRSFGHKTTFDADYLIPFMVDEVLPGDTFDSKTQIFARLSTPIFPIMDNVFIDTFFFFVPNRLIWDNWERFQGAQDNPDDPTDYEVPIVEGAASPWSILTGSLGDYFGLPVGNALYNNSEHAPMALPFRAYYLIWNEWFRDENLQDSVLVPKNDGPDDIADYVVLKRGKRHDYFTSCLPWPQKGDAVSIPLVSGNVPVIGNGTSIGLQNGSSNAGMYNTNGTTDLFAGTSDYGGATGSAAIGGSMTATKRIGLSTDPTKSGMIADFTSAVAATINDLRYAFAVQQILETDARGGTRYVEHLLAHWGVVSPDFRLQRPEYLGGSSQRVDVRGVPQTSETASTPQGNLAAYASVQSVSGFRKSFVEHGIIIGLVNVRADITYQQGMRRMWSRRTRFDFYMPQLAHLGEQAVLNKEIMYTSNDPDVNGNPFGYQERWAEYRYFPSMITGILRSNVTAGFTTLDSWHLSEDFGSLPSLNATFIQSAVPMSRILAVSTEPHVIFDSYTQLKCARPMPVYSIPGLQRL